MHRTSNTYVLDNFKKIEKKIIRLIGIEKYKQIMKNGNKIINNEDI